MKSKIKLYVISTPIGNIKDITLRAIEVIKKTQVFACEDTRQFKKILNYFGIKNKILFPHYDKNEKNSAKGIIEYLIKNNLNGAIVSDAGTPILNDPGFLIIREALEKGIEIVYLPGASAVIAGIVLSNISSQFTFLGFLKPKSGQRQNQLISLPKGTYVIFLSPHRIFQELDDVAKAFGNDSRAFVGKEITKKFECHYRGTIEEIIAKLKQDIIRGEYLLVAQKK